MTSSVVELQNHQNTNSNNPNTIKNTLSKEEIFRNYASIKPKPPVANISNSIITLKPNKTNKFKSNTLPDNTPPPPL